MLTEGHVVRSAIEEDRLIPVFQPIVNLRTGEVTGFEVLTRWRDPDRGLILPSNFIRLAEEQGLVDVLTEKVLRNAFRVARSAVPGLQLNINISPLHLRTRELPDQLKEWCREADWPLDQLTIEITESAIIDNVEMASRVADDLKSMGCRLALDDFGTGYSSLIHLQALPFDELKVDRGFVAEMTIRRESRKIVGAVLELAHNLGLITVAEGIETQAQCQMLFRLGCHSGQGWLFGKPLPAGELGTVRQCPLLCSCPDAQMRTVQPGNEQAASDQAAQLKTLYNSAPVGLCFLDKEMRYTSINRYLAAMNGFSIEDHIGKTPKELLPEFFPLIEPHIKAALAGEPPFSIQLNRPGGHGETITIVANYAPVFDEGGEIIGASIAVVDFTERARAEDAVRARVEQYGKILEQSPFSPWLADPDMNLLEVGPKWLAMTGMTSVECLGLGWLKAVHPDDLEARIEAGMRALQTGKSFESVYRIRLTDGDWRWVRTKALPLRTASGEIAGWYGYVVDVEEQRLESERANFLLNSTETGRVAGGPVAN